jgi:hypothetical protein
MRQRWALGAAVLLATGGLGWAAGEAARGSARLGAAWLGLAQIDFVGLRALGARELAARAQLAGGTPLLEIDTAALAARIAAHPRVERAAAALLPPGRVVVVVRERSPVAREAASGQGIDAGGARFALVPGEAQRLAGVRGELARALPVLAACVRAGLQPAALDATQPAGVRVQLHARGPVLWIGEEPQAALGRWSALRNSGLLARYRPVEIDLRFAGNAVLRGRLTEEGPGDGAPRR